MGGCSVLGCCNRSEKGFIMKYFPKDPQRRKEWIANMQRKNWIPTDYAVICEVHFAPEMWEKTRVDGKRKLKSIAIPTLFSFDEPISVKETPNKPVTIPTEVADINMPSTRDHIGTPSTDTDADSTSKPCESANDADKRSTPSTDTDADGKRKLKRITIPTVFSFAGPISVKETPNKPVTKPTEVADINMPSTSDHIGTPSTDTDINSTSKPCESANDADKRSIKALELKCTQYNRHFKKLFTNYKILKKNLRNCQNKLKAATNADGSVKVMRTIFNEDQITALKRSSTKFMKWSTATVTNSLKLKSACGINGYKELLNQKYPLPSLRTLRRHQEKLKLETIRHSEV